MTIATMMSGMQELSKPPRHHPDIHGIPRKKIRTTDLSFDCADCLNRLLLFFLF